MPRAHDLAKEFDKLDPLAHKATKRRIRAALIREIRWSIPLDLVDATLIGLRRARQR